MGWATATTGTTFGVYGETASPTGSGVFGEATATSGDSAGVFGQSGSSTGRGVSGEATAATGQNYGVRGVSASTSGRGVLGWASASTGATYGVYAQSNSSSGFGVFGLAGSFSGTTYGVYGRSYTAYGVYSQGDFGASGTKAFRIDHPDDPANKYLLHYAAESPEVINFYRGTVTLDGAGSAVVELPAYFARINKDATYQLTAMGAPMPLLHLAEEIDASAMTAGAAAAPGEPAPICSFRIGGGVPGGRVSWRVETVRNDAWVRSRGAPVEVDKIDLEKGTYQHPELYGQPAEMGMNHTDAPRVDR
jgi:hypothetical protein